MVFKSLFVLDNPLHKEPTFSLIYRFVLTQLSFT